MGDQEDHVSIEDTIAEAKKSLRRRKLWARVNKGWEVANTIADAAVELGPLAVGLKTGNKLGYALFGLAAARRLWGLKRSHWPKQRSPAGKVWWPDVDHHVALEFIHTLVRCQCGTPVDSAEGVDLYEYEGVLWGKTSTNYVAPKANPQPLIDWLWDQCGEISVTGTNPGNIAVTKSPERPEFAPTGRAIRMAERCLLFKAKGYKIAVLADGRPGSGKSYAVSHAARALGDRILRANLTETSIAVVAQFARLLRPVAVILDDIDRYDTDTALATIEGILEMGCAVLCTSNDKGKIAAAFKRAGRVDMRYQFETIDPDVLDSLLEPWPGLYDNRLVRERLATATVAEVKRYLEHYDAVDLRAADEYLDSIREEE